MVLNSDDVFRKADLYLENFFKFACAEASVIGNTLFKVILENSTGSFIFGAQTILKVNLHHCILKI